MKKSISFFIGLAAVALLFIFGFSLMRFQITSTQAEEGDFIMQASANGTSCTQNSDCTSGHCFDTCLPSYPLSAELDINNWSASDRDGLCSGWMRGENYGNAADAKADFDSYGGGTAGWSKWDYTVCGVDVWWTYAAPNYIYKAYTSAGISFRLAEDEGFEWGCSDDFIKKVMGYVLCGQGGGPVCGDGTCSSTETCSSCPSDCGTCTTLKDDGESCTLDSECSGGYCVHSICRAFPFYWGDGHCDTDEGETCLDSSDPDFCSPDCKTTTTRKDNGESCSSNAECSSTNCRNGVCCRSGVTCCQKDADCDNVDLFCKLSENVCYYKGDDGVHSCTEWRQCKGGHCVHGICRSAAAHCGDNACDTDHEDCSSCSSDCGQCQVEETTTEETTTEEKKSDGENCSGNSQCQSNNCVESTCRPSGYTWCGDGTCQSSEECSCQDCTSEDRCKLEIGQSCQNSADCASGYCADGACAVSDDFDTLLFEYQGIVNDLNKKIDVTEMDKFDVSPADMHEAIIGLAEGYRGTANEQKGISLLKHAIAAEQLGLAVYEAESDMAELLAKSSWESLEAYLLYKIKAIMADRLGQLAENKELAGMVESFQETAEVVAQSVESGEVMSDNDLTQILSQLGITDESQVSEFIKTTNSALSEAAGNTKRYIEKIESVVREKYIEIYKQMFISNFEEAISNQMVYFQVGLWHHTENLGDIKQTNVPYEQYRSKIEEMQKVLAEYKDFVLGDDNIFDKSKKMTEKLTTATEVLGNLLDQAATYGQALDKGAGLASKETHFGDLVDKVKEYNDDLNSAIEAAAGVLDLAGKFAESLFGTYEEAKVYAVFFNAYSDWCDAAMGDCVAVLRIPGTDLKVPIESVYELGRKAGTAVDVVAVQAGSLAYSLATSVESFFNASIDAFIEVAEKAETKIKEGEIIVKKFVYKTVEGARDQVVAICSWGSSLLAYNYSEESFSIFKKAWAADKSVIEFALISPSGRRYPGTLGSNGEQSYVVIDNPEEGEWQTEFVGRTVEGTENIQLAINVDEILPGETKETLPGYEKKSSNNWQMYALVIGIVAVIVLAGWGIVRFVIWLVRRKKLEKSKDKDIIGKAKEVFKDEGKKKPKKKKKIWLIIIIVIIILGVGAAILVDWQDLKYFVNNKNNQNTSSQNTNNQNTSAQNTNSKNTNAQNTNSKTVATIDDCQDVDLSKNVTDYYYTKEEYQCKEYQDDITAGKIVSKCKTSYGQFRKHFVKEIDVSGKDKVTVKAAMELAEHDKLFTECSGVGVKYEGYVRLVILSADPRSNLDSVCNKLASGDDWKKCSIGYDNKDALGYCMVPKCATEKKCDFAIDVTGKNKVYAVFVVADAWNYADVEGTLSNLQICQK